MNILPLDEVVDREVGLAKSHGFEFAQKALIPGRIYEINNNSFINGRKECPIGTLDRIELQNTLDTPELRKYSNGPLISHLPWTQESENMILSLLNYRLLPFFTASSLGNIREALYKNPDRNYRIAIVGTDSTKVFTYSFSSIVFHEESFQEGIRTDETYYLGDIVDFYEGRQDLYSSFWHRLNPDTMYRLWVSLGANFLNHDLVYKKYKLHFEQAFLGKHPTDWFSMTLSGIKK